MLCSLKKNVSLSPEECKMRGEGESGNIWVLSLNQSRTVWILFFSQIISCTLEIKLIFFTNRKGVIFKGIST